MQISVLIFVNRRRMLQITPHSYIMKIFWLQTKLFCFERTATARGELTGRRRSRQSTGLKKRQCTLRFDPWTRRTSVTAFKITAGCVFSVFIFKFITKKWLKVLQRHGCARPLPLNCRHGHLRTQQSLHFGQIFYWTAEVLGDREEAARYRSGMYAGRCDSGGGNGE